MRRHQDPGTEAPARPVLRTPAGGGQQQTATASTDPWPAGDTDPGYYGTPAGNIWHPDTEGNHP